MQSFWKNNHPIIVNNNTINKSKQIISNDILLEKINKIIDNSNIKLEYEINSNGITNIDILNFVNENYYEDIEHKFTYELSAIEYYVKNSLVICYYLPNTNKTSKNIIGIVIGKKSNLIIDNEKFNSIEVNFLMLKQKYRNYNLTPLILNILLKESIQKYNTSIAHYTIGNDIKSPYYCIKQYHHRMININNLIQNKFTNNNNSINLIQKYNTFEKYLENQQLLYINKKQISENMIREICINIIKYSKTNYKIYEEKTIEQLTDLFNHDSFHHFIFIDKNIEIKNYICINKVIIFNNNNKSSYKNGIIYTGFYDDDINKVIEMVSKYIYDNDIFDVITWTDFFDINNNICKSVKGSGNIKYYLYNLEMNTIKNNENGLFTI